MTVPKNVKQPKDHEPKAENATEPEAPESEVLTVRGIEYEIDPGVRDDFELLDEMVELERDRTSALLPSILRRLLGQRQMRVAMETLRDPKTGRVSIESGMDFVFEVIGALNPN